MTLSGSLISKSVSKNDSFTLIELLVVIGILAILTAAVVLVLNPVEYLKQSRDATRMSDLSSVNQALSVLESQGVTNFGSVNTVYVSIPNASSDCSGLGLPTLPSPWAYHCAPSATLQSVNGTGWIPVDFTQSPTLSFSTLPIDPTNSTSTGNYYTYTPGGSWELDTILESSKYRNNTTLSKPNLPGVYAKGTNLTLSPIYNTSGLVGYWPFDNGSGSAVVDSSGNNIGGTWYGTPAGDGGTYYISGKIGKAATFNGSDDYIQIVPSTVLNSVSSAITVAFWMKASSNSAWNMPLCKDDESGSGGWLVQVKSSTNLRIDTSGGLDQEAWSTGLDSTWHFITFTVNGTSASGFLDGQILDTYPIVLGVGIGNSLNLVMGQYIYGGHIFLGSIDDVRIYNRALSASEIKALYNATK